MRRSRRTIAAWIVTVLVAPPALAQAQTPEPPEEPADETPGQAEEAPGQAEEAPAPETPEPPEAPEEPEAPEPPEEAAPQTQPAPEEAPQQPAPETPAPASQPAPAPATAPEPQAAAAATQEAALRLYTITTRNTYAPVRLDIYDADSREVVATGTTTDLAAGAKPLSFDLPPGIYKIVRAGASFDTRTDFATLQLEPGGSIDYVIVVEPNTHMFRGAGIVTGELPQGVTIAGIRVALNAGGSLALNHQDDVVGQTNGVSGLYGLFGNFSLVFDRDNHVVNVSSDLELTLLDRPSASIFATSDRFSADALYAYNINNPYIGPYIRGSFKTSVFPSYLYLDSDTPEVSVTRENLDGTEETEIFGADANQDDLRVRLADPLSPIVLQEEIGANLKAVTVDLLLLKLDIGTRIGYAFRQGIVDDLFVVEGDEQGPVVRLREVDDYNTHGPTIGADGTVTFARWLFGSAKVGVIAPVRKRDRAGDDFADQLLIDLAGTAGFKVPILTELLYATFDYTFRLERDGFLTDETQIDQTIMGRVNVSLF